MAINSFLLQVNGSACWLRGIFHTCMSPRMRASPSFPLWGLQQTLRVMGTTQMLPRSQCGHVCRVCRVAALAVAAAHLHRDQALSTSTTHTGTPCGYRNCGCSRCSSCGCSCCCGCCLLLSHHSSAHADSQSTTTHTGSITHKPPSTHKKITQHRCSPLLDTPVSSRLSLPEHIRDICLPRCLLPRVYASVAAAA